jgi:2-oxoglutarate ferredoxin oxidoreductase subunit delta
MAELQGRVRIATAICKGCGLCTIGCPLGVLAFTGNTANLKGYQPPTITHPEKCTGCGNCALMCPDSALTVERFSSKRRDAHA